MDLLVYVVQRNELKPSQISISEITDQFLSYLDGIERTDLTEAGDFLEMASRLMALKARELLPREEQSEEELFEFDEQRTELIRAIVEYRAFRKMADGLRELEEENRNSFTRGRREGFGRGEEGVQGRVAGIFQLYEAFSLSMKASRPYYGDAIHTVEIDYFTIQDAQQQVGNTLRRRGRAAFDELVGLDRQPLVTATTFQALLEMVKTEQVAIRQLDPTSVLWTYRKRDNPEYFDELNAPPVELQDLDSERLAAGLVDLLRDRSTVRGDQLGLDDLARELTKRIQEGARVREQDLNHLLSGGSFADLEKIEEEPRAEAEMVEEEGDHELPPEEVLSDDDQDPPEEEETINFDSLFQ